MGLYDELPGGVQVKCWWSDLHHIVPGNEVLAIDGIKDYDIALVEGGFAVVYSCIFKDITKYIEVESVEARAASLGWTMVFIPKRPLFDKWGNQIKELLYHA